MSKPAARMLDPAGHGGMIMMGEFTVLINGMPAARVGDPLICPGFNGPIPHIMGNIVMGSTSVQIGGGFAARMGDQTGCGIAGMIAKGMPAIFGPAIFTMSPPTPAAPKAETMSAVELGPAELLAISHTDTSNADGDGAIDSFSVAQIQGETVIGENTVSGSYRLGNVDTQYSTDSSGNVTGFNSQISSGQTQISRRDNEGNADVITLTGPNAQLGADTLAGQDNRRTGLLIGGSAQASLAEIQYDQTRDTPLPFPFSDYSVRLTRTVGAEVGGAGAQGRAGIFHDAQDNRVHATVLGGIEAEIGLKLGLDISVGLIAPVPTVSILGIGIPLTPGTIMKGSHNVMIGG